MAAIRILQVFTIMDRGGAESMIMNYYRKIDRTKVQFDFLVHRDKKGDYDDEILGLGGAIYKLPAINPLWPYKYYSTLRKFFKNHKEYYVIHAHLNTFSSFPLKIAKESNIPCRIAHAHIAMKKITLKSLISKSEKTSDLIKILIKIYLKRQIHTYPTHLFSCGTAAGKWLFGESVFEIMNNAIDSNKFIFNPMIREAYQDKYNLNNTFVVGHVGRFDSQKNHLFLLEVFNSLLKIQPNCVLFLIGDGPLKTKVEAAATQLQIYHKIHFTGVRNDINNLLQLMDCFVFPSLYEGLPVTLIEAQASGTPIVAADTISKEVKITDNLAFIPLSKPALHWAKSIQTILLEDTPKQDIKQTIINNGYDVVSNALKMQNFYIQKHHA